MEVQQHRPLPLLLLLLLHHPLWHLVQQQMHLLPLLLLHLLLNLLLPLLLLHLCHQQRQQHPLPPAQQLQHQLQEHQHLHRQQFHLSVPWHSHQLNHQQQHQHCHQHLHQLLMHHLRHLPHKLLRQQQLEVLQLPSPLPLPAWQDRQP